eukprot:9367697-Pyramimonas_sp.AAC.1
MRGACARALRALPGALGAGCVRGSGCIRGCARARVGSVVPGNGGRGRSSGCARAFGRAGRGAPARRAWGVSSLQRNANRASSGRAPP